MEKPTWESLNGSVQIFNAIHKVGDKVNLKMDDDSIQEVTVQAPAQIIGGHSAVGWFIEISGCYALERVIY
jgi:hypothetical protein